MPFDLHLRHGFFDAETCRTLVAEMRASPSGPALTYGKADSGLVDEKVRKVTRINPSLHTVESVITRLSDYRPTIEAHFGINLSACEEPQFLCYQTGDFFVAHQDGNTGLTRLATESRRVSVTIFLNRPAGESEEESYSGGSLKFSEWRSGEEFTLAGETGMLVAFRSELTHEVLPVTQGERYAIVSWYR